MNRLNDVAGPLEKLDQPGQPRKILVIRRDNIGDLVCTTPLFAALRARFPDAWIGVLANSYNAPVLVGNPDIDEVFAYTKLKHRARGQGRLAALWQRLALVWNLRRRHIDEVILPGGMQASALRFARWVAPRHVVVASVNLANSAHEVERSFACLAKYGIKETPPACKAIADEPLAARIAATLPAALAGRRLIALHLSARKPRQRWPVERFAALARQLHAAHACGFLLFWSPGAADDPLHPGDDAKAAELVAQMGDLPVAAVKTHHLSELMAGLSLCAEVICSDGGAMHIAAGLGKPIVCFFGNSDAARWHPWAVPYALLQPASCDVVDISVEEALAAWRRLPTA
ncbi:glycosyltransferase family 9 protein [Rugosibacter aromaticivorans]|uniref:glycosyltransferase family 9 protein n=1 Tax=Rugosibacter aromaticivorans TaxID=1565605 RepID=UPI00192A28EF|nr:glycosyltransferase family 9 protein [Rugosibacter aromaticivorans]